MTLTVDKDIFAERLAIAARFTSNKISSATSLQGVLFKGEKSGITMYSTNLNTYYSAPLPMAEKSAEVFQVVIEPKKIMEFLAFLEPGDIKVDITDKQITLKKGKTKGNFPLIVSEDFPFPPEMKEKPAKIDVNLFVKQLPSVLFSASSDDTRPVLTGINFVNSENELLIVSTDGFRLSIIKDKKLGDFPSMNVAADFLQEIVRYMKEVKEVSFAYSPEEKMVQFIVGDQTFYSRLIEGDYPPFEKVIPSEAKTTITLDKADLQRNVKLISVFARDFSNVIVCEFAKDGLSIRPKKEGNAENTAFQEITIEGDGQTIAFNFKFLLDFLNHAEGKNIIIELLRPDAPVVLKTESNAAFMHIIMPIRITE